MNYKILFLLYFFLSLSLYAVEIREENSLSNFKISYLYDSSNIQKIEEIIESKEFKQISNTIRFGIYYDTLWLRLVLINITDKPQERIIRNSESYSEKNTFYEYDNKKQLLNKEDNGLKISIENRTIDDPFPSYKVYLAPYQTKIIYMNYKSNFGVLTQLNIYKVDTYIKLRREQDYLFVFYFGIIFTIIIYIFVLYFYTKEKLYIYYGLYLLFYNIWMFMHSGFYIYVIPYSLFYLSFSSIPLAFYMLIYFTQALFDNKNPSPLLQKTFKIYKILFLLLSLYLLFDFQRGVVLISIVIFSLFYLGYLLIKESDGYLKFYSFALMLFLLSVAFPSLVLYNLIPYNFYTRNANIFGAMVEIVLFSIILANHISQLKKDKSVITKDLLLLENRQNKMLSLKVEEQTKKLTILFQELHHRVKNNFQFILTFILVQKSTLDKQQDNKLLDALEMISKRIYTISLMHELLYKRENVEIDFIAYIEVFLKSFKENNIIFITNIKDIDLDFDNAVTFGLILNELITNSIKYAFDSTPNPTITIDFQKINNKHTFKFRDNG
ncbi:MAG: 7TM diverse intracellular signaling domain-containing protein, partial [Sulfurovum sp.]